VWPAPVVPERVLRQQCTTDSTPLALDQRLLSLLTGGNQKSSAVWELRGWFLFLYLLARLGERHGSKK